jgi:hypothetical protein
MGRLAKLSARFIGEAGFSIGIDDVSPAPALQRAKAALLEENYAKVATLVRDFKRGSLDLLPGCTEDESLEVRAAPVACGVLLHLWTRASCSQSCAPDLFCCPDLCHARGRWSAGALVVLVWVEFLSVSLYCQAGVLGMCAAPAHMSFFMLQHRFRTPSWCAPFAPAVAHLTASPTMSTASSVAHACTCMLCSIRSRLRASARQTSPADKP